MPQRNLNTVSQGNIEEEDKPALNLDKKWIIRSQTRSEGKHYYVYLKFVDMKNNRSENDE